MERTEIKPEFLGLGGLGSFPGNVSSPRLVMDSSHFASHLPLMYPDERLIKTGIEYELGKTINDVRVDKDCVVKAVISRYGGKGVTPPGHVLLVEFEQDGKIFIDMIDGVTYKSQHNFFGYPLDPTPTMQDLSYNSVLSKGDVLFKTTSYGREGSYDYGLNANVAFMSHPSVSDDGFVISESFAKRASLPVITKRVININKNTIPINLYGDDTTFKFIPDIGQAVRADGLLCALRDRNDWFSVVDLSTRALSEVDVTFDTMTYTNPDSIVLDVNIIRGNYSKPEFPSKMTEQLDEYAAMLLSHYETVIKKYEEILREKKALYGHTDDIRLTPRMHRFISDCYIKVSSVTNPKIKLCYRKLPIDQYRIEVVTMSVLKPNLGFKLTDLSASKGVICHILPDDQMPVDANGVRAEVITDNTSTISRMNLGRAYESYMGAFSRDNRTKLTQLLLEKFGPDYLVTEDPHALDFARQYLRGMYELINSDMVNFLDSLNHEELVAHVKEVIHNNLYLYYPPDNENNITDVISSTKSGIEHSPYKPLMSKVTYTDMLGRQVTTTEDIQIGVLYIMFIDKIASSYSAVSSAKVNNFGFPVKGAQSDKNRYPHSQTPTKLLGETEFRILVSNMGPEAAADMMDLALNPNSHKALIRNTLQSTKAFDTDFDIDRSVIQYGETDSLQILRHIFTASGFDFHQGE